MQIGSYIPGFTPAQARIPRQKASQPDHCVIDGGTTFVPPMNENTLYWRSLGNKQDGRQEQDVYVELLENSTEDDPVVRIKGHSHSGTYDFTRHIKDIDPRNASYAELCALVAWEDKVNPSQKNRIGTLGGGVLLPTPLGMEEGDVLQRKDYVSLSQKYLASGKFGPSIAEHTKNLLELYDKLVPESDSPEGNALAYSVYRKAADDTLIELMKTVL